MSDDQEQIPVVRDLLRLPGAGAPPPVAPPVTPAPPPPSTPGSAAQLARTTIREREMAIRIALGAGRARLVRQLAVESIVLAVAGGALGLLVAMWGVDALPTVLEARVPRADGIRVDASVMLFALGATMATGLFFGMAPAIQTFAGGAASLKEGGRAVAGFFSRAPPAAWDCRR